MLEITFLIFLNIFITGECFINYNVNTQPKMIPNELRLLYNKIMQPLQRISDVLPDHNVEVQLDISNGLNNIPIPKQKRANMLSLRKLTPKVKLREIYSDVEDATPITTTPTPTSVNQQLTLQQQQMLQQLQQQQQQQLMQQQQLVHQKLLQQQFQQANPQNFQRQQFISQFRQQIPQNQQVYNNNNGLGQYYYGQKLRNLDETETAPETPAPAQASEQTPNSSSRQPVYMEDLKKALDDFEKKFLSKQKENKIQSVLDNNINNNIEGDLGEATKPLLKKDLWMALGLKYMTGCPHLNNNQNKPTPGPNQQPNQNYQPPQTPDNSGFRVNRILQLLKRARETLKQV